MLLTWMKWRWRRCSIPCDRWPDRSYNPTSALFFRRISILTSSKRSTKTQVHIDTTAIMVVATCESQRSHMIDQSAVCQVVSFERNAKIPCPPKEKLQLHAANSKRHGDRFHSSRKVCAKLPRFGLQPAPSTTLFPHFFHLHGKNQ